MIECRFIFSLLFLLLSFDALSEPFENDSYVTSKTEGFTRPGTDILNLIVFSDPITTKVSSFNPITSNGNNLNKGRVQVIFPADTVFFNSKVTGDVKADLESLTIDDNYSKTELFLDSAEFFLTRNLNTSLKYAKEAKDLSGKLGDLSVDLKVMAILGKIYTEKGYLSEGLNSYFEGLEKLHSSDAKLSEFPFLTLGIGEILILIHETDKAIVYLNEVENELRFDPSINRNLLPKILETYAKLHIEKKEWVKAYSYLKEGLKYLEEEPPSPLKTNLLNLMGDVYFGMSNYQVSKDYFFQAKAAARDQEDINGLSSALIGLSALSYIEGDIKLSMRESVEAFQLAEILGNEKKKRLIANKISLLFKEVNNLDSSAYFFMVKSNSFLDIEEKNAKLKILKKELILKNTNDLDDLEKKNNVYFTKQIIFLILIVLLFIGLLISTIKLKRDINIIYQDLDSVNSDILGFDIENRHLNSQILQKRRELMVSLIHMFKKEKDNKELKLSLINFRKNLSKTNQNTIDDVIDELDVLYGDGAPKRSVDLFFGLNDKFLERLCSDFPELTENEKFLSILFLLGLNADEISAIMGIQTDSLQVAKTRLKNKLGLNEKGISPENFLIKYDYPRL